MKCIAILVAVTVCGCASLRSSSETPEAISEHLAKTGLTWKRLNTKNPMPDEFLGDLRPEYVFRSSTGVIRAYEYGESEAYWNYAYREYDPAKSIHAGGGSINPKKGNTSNKRIHRTSL